MKVLVLGGHCNKHGHGLAHIGDIQYWVEGLTA